MRKVRCKSEEENCPTTPQFRVFPLRYGSAPSLCYLPCIYEIMNTYKLSIPKVEQQREQYNRSINQCGPTTCAFAGGSQRALDLSLCCNAHAAVAFLRGSYARLRRLRNMHLRSETRYSDRSC